MALKKKSDLETLKDLSPEDRADLSALFESIEGQNTQIVELRKKTESADRVVQRNAEMEKLLSEREKLTTELQEKLNALTAKPAPAPENWDDLLPFKELRDSLTSFMD
jgi:neutral trehalase